MPIRSLEEKAEIEAIEAKEREAMKKAAPKKRKPKVDSWYKDMLATGAPPNWDAGIYISEGLYLYPDGELRGEDEDEEDDDEDEDDDE
jgi:hypothetical protein